MFLVLFRQNVIISLFVGVSFQVTNGYSTHISKTYQNSASSLSRGRNNEDWTKLTSVVSYNKQFHEMPITSTMLDFHITKTILMCKIIKKRTERTDKNACCTFLLNLTVVNIVNYYAKFCISCSKYLDNISGLNSAFCKEKNHLSSFNSHFELYNQRKRRKFAEKDSVFEKQIGSAKMISKQVMGWRSKRDAKLKGVTETTDTKVSTAVSSETTIHVTKRGINETGNQTSSRMQDWEAILQMEYSKDPQWALVCVVFVVTLVLGGVWKSGMCKNPHGEFIDPVTTHNLEPEFVKDVVTRKAKFLAWFKYLKNRRKKPPQQQQEEMEQFSSSSDDDSFDMTEMTQLI